MFLWVLAAFGRLQSEVGAMAVKGDIIPRGVWAGLGMVFVAVPAEQRVELRMLSISCR